MDSAVHEPVRWGILSTAKIGREKVIPAMQNGELCRIVAIGSRDLGRAKQVAEDVGIPKAYGSYEELMADADIEAIYNPLPNHLHIPWTAKAAEAGKHVLCEKPIALTAAEAQTLIEVRDRTGKLIEEAFMVRHHPQWRRVRGWVREGRIGRLRAVQGFFSYMNLDPANIRNQADIGGGGLYDIGCYPITTSRFLFEAEPKRVMALIERDPELRTDRLTSAILDFDEGQATFTCSTQLVPYQRMQAFGTKGRIEVEIPFNAPTAEPCRISIDDGSGAPSTSSAVTETLEATDQYTVQGDDFSLAVRGAQPIEFPLENAVRNMAVLDALFRSAETGQWESVAGD
jgi:predicted dehydrogenase